MPASHSSSDERIEFLRRLFEDYLALPRRAADREFTNRLQALQAWETEDIRRRHALACADNPHYESVLEYYLAALHNGLDLEGMVERGPGGLENARKLNKAYELFANAIEFSVLSAALQDRLVEAMGEQVITAEAHATAPGKCRDADTREHRLDLLVRIGHQVAPHIDSRLIHTGFKMLGGMFRTAGMGEIHSTLDTGFRQLRGVPRLAQTLAEFAETEKLRLLELTDSYSEYHAD